MTGQPSVYELWKQAGGPTDAFDKHRYRQLLTEHGHLPELPPGGHARPLPAGWPDRRFRRSRRWLETAHLTAEERQAALGPHRWQIPSFEDTEDP